MIAARELRAVNPNGYADPYVKVSVSPLRFMLCMYCLLNDHLVPSRALHRPVRGPLCCSCSSRSSAARPKSFRAPLIRYGGRASLLLRIPDQEVYVRCPVLVNTAVDVWCRLKPLHVQQGVLVSVNMKKIKIEVTNVHTSALYADMKACAINKSLCCFRYTISLRPMAFWTWKCGTGSGAKLY